MADAKLSALTALTGANVAAADEFYIRDESELAASESKRITSAELLLWIAAATATLTNKTITGTKETVFTITDGAAFEIDPANGGIQTITLGANRTPVATNFTAGQSVTLMIADGTAYTITWSTVAVTWVGGAAPTLATSGYTVVELWKVGSTIYGAHVGDVA